MEWDHSELMEKYLAELSGKSVVEQIRQRRVKAVIADSVANVGLFGDGYSIRFRRAKPEEEQLLDFGHEICHLFGYNPEEVSGAGRPLEEEFYFEQGAYYDYFLNLPYDYDMVWDEEEKFCEAFAEAWLKQRNNREEARVLIQKALADEKEILQIE